MISIQKNDFDVAHEYQLLVENNKTDGAVVIFTGLVRDFNQGQSVQGLFLEHYPNMTERALADIVTKAKLRWQLGELRVIHRIGKLQLSDQIVFVGVTSHHREAAFEACQFIMDYLKNHVPLWKKERTTTGERWVEFNNKESKALSRWR